MQCYAVFDIFLISMNYKVSYVCVEMRVVAYFSDAVYYYNCYITSVCWLSLQVLVRFNFLVIILCLVMNRPYQFYYFVPLVSFWFVVIYVTMAVWPRITTTSVNSMY